MAYFHNLEDNFQIDCSYLVEENFVEAHIDFEVGTAEVDIVVGDIAEVDTVVEGIAVVVDIVGVNIAAGEDIAVEADIVEEECFQLYELSLELKFH